MNFKRHAVMFLATGGGIGYSPVAPGTFGSVLGVPISWALSKLSWPWAGAAGVLIIVAAAASAHLAAQMLNARDPRCIVIDEIAGMGVTLVGMPFNFVTGAAGFILFRIFDIVKPPPIRQLEQRLGGGWGIVLDDLLAGVMAQIALRIGLYLAQA